MKRLETGEYVSEMIALRKVGSAKGPNGTYEVFMDQKGQPIVQSQISGRKFLLTWENILEIAVMNGVDEKAKTVIGYTYNMECEGGRFSSDHGFKSVPFEEKH